MRTAILIVAVLLIVLGVVALGFQSITFFTHDRVLDAGPFKVDVTQPHTIVLNPILGVVALAAGLVMLVAARRPGAV
jgi:uncharacterized membrane protein HdeD (DUF308 family)